MSKDITLYHSQQLQMLVPGVERLYLSKAQGNKVNDAVYSSMVH